MQGIQQIFTGFSLLSRCGYITLRQKFLPDEGKIVARSKHWADYHFYNLIVTINGKFRVCYDTHDWNWIDRDVLSAVDFYFKRSYDEKYLESEFLQSDRLKLFPMGLNYHVESTGFDRFKIQRSRLFAGKERLKMILKGIAVDKVFSPITAVERLSSLEGMPDFLAKPRVLFMARAWDPSKVESKTQSDIIHEINMTRANCIRAMKKEYNYLFLGGLARDEFALKNFPDCVLSNDSLSNKRAYLKTLKNFPICIATMGLNGSNGWKLGEYVAFSKAIVSEPLRFQVNGDFQDGKNYLEFGNPDELLNAVARLIDDKHLRMSLMLNNFRYYRAFVRPDSLVLNSLAVVSASSGLLA